ncbi:protein PFC0760c-like isoform X2 [Melanaphis sacchari]|uniref:protein PFC0760c-like isoform X2 n=1 Tax=Melanaphis sacchari TaxID=742174 RepID=UPI000DC1489D|nr:protein PFC0760c-like isoform X2 [Melanaphis sacchari]
MSGDDVNDSSMLDDMSKFNLTFYESSIELWRLEEMCRLKIKSIEEIKHSTEQVALENKWIEKQLHDTKSRIEEVKEDIVSIDNITNSLNETLAHLEIQHKKKEFTLNKLKCDYELQLFIKMELWQKEEERLNNIPEVKLLKIADCELKNTKLEYEKLLINLQNLVEKIDIATNENDKKRNHIIVEYSKAYFEMLSLNKREKNCKNRLRRLNEEYNEKCCVKNELLEHQNKKITKQLFWSYTPSTIDSNIFDMKFDLLNQVLKDDINIQNSKLNKPKKNVTFLLSPEDKISLKTNDENLKNILNVEDVEENIIQFTKKDLIESEKMDFENNDKHIGDDDDLNSHINKCKTSDVLSDIKFKKSFNSLQDRSIMNSKIFQPSKMKTNKNINMKNNFNQEKLISLSLSTNSNNHYNKNSHLTDKDQSQKLNTLKSMKHSNLENLNSDNINIYNDLSQLSHENVSNDQNKELSDTFWNFCAEPILENSGNSSFCGSDLSELFENSYDINQLQDNTQFNFLNSFNNNSDVTPESNFQRIKIPQQSGNFMFQPSQSESSEKLTIDKNTSINEATFSASNDFIKPNKQHFLSPDQFKFNFL